MYVMAKCPKGISVIKLSASLREVVVALNKKDNYDMKYQEIFIDINNTLRDIFHEGNLSEYALQILIKNLQKSLTDLKKKIYSCGTNTFGILSECIEFKFLHYSINDIFPRGAYFSYFQLDDKDAEFWWTKNFQNRILVQANEFANEICKIREPIGDIHTFLKSICFTSHDWFYEFINKSLFNLFLRFFGGWSKFCDLWNSIYFHPGHMVMATCEQVTHELMNIKKTIRNYRSAERSYIFCINWRSDSGLWNLFRIDRNENIVNKLVEPNSLLMELSNKSYYFYPKGGDPYDGIPCYMIGYRQQGLPSVPSNVLSDPEDSRHDSNTLGRSDTLIRSSYEFDDGHYIDMWPENELPYQSSQASGITAISEANHAELSEANHVEESEEVIQTNENIEATRVDEIKEEPQNRDYIVMCAAHGQSEASHVEEREQELQSLLEPPTD